ncbi:MAG TPA: AmmeMemoRadiSam system protein A, partial [Candidatus Sulfotelmatobacter sp.]|nr:AmmeMemoRadiSam system protein A [Candidatus Sulfotelmatobacter sp.]
KKLDGKGIEAMVNGDLGTFIRDLSNGDTEACGAPAIITTLMLAPALGANKIELLNYTNSGDVTGDKERVVGYAAIVFWHQATTLTAGEQKKLLKIARRTIENKLAGKPLPVYTPPEAGLNERRGAFVTLTSAGRLRGCIGYIQPVKPLFAAVQEMAVAAATSDRRFSPVEKAELPGIKIEISALTPLKRIKELSEIELGRDGLYIIKGENSGLLLPQVATENNWDKTAFLENLCYKAGLPSSAWQDKDAVLYRFTAEVFHE